MVKRILLITLLTIFYCTASAQRVGLVLAGGGSHGLYHVGIIKALEDNGIPIDYVSGASMGAIVSGMYAAGYSPDEMIRLFITDTVSNWLSGKIPDQYSYYFKKFAPTPEMIAIRINPDTTKLAAFQLPTNLISPYRIDLAFMEMISGASWAAGEDFDRLMVPFRCVASDVYNKKSVVFRKGSLPFAIRTSMTFPMVFKPLMMDSVLLYDGGVYNNFPWQPLKEDFEPDIFIGGVCSENYPNPGPDNIMGQISVMITRDTDYSLPDTSDISIRRLFPNVPIFDYSNGGRLIALGYEDAMRQMPQILKKIPRRISQDEIRAKREAFKSRIKPLIFEKIIIEGLTPSQTDYVMRQLGSMLHDHISAEYFEDKYMKILATEVFTGGFPEVTYNPASGYYTIKIKMQCKASMKVSLGGNISSTSLNQLYLGFQYQNVGRKTSTYNLDGYLGTFYNAIKVGGRHDIYTRFPFYIDYGYSYENFDYDSYNSNKYYINRDWRYKVHSQNTLTASIAVPVFQNSAFRGRISGGSAKDEYFMTLHNSQDRPSRSEFLFYSIGTEIQTHTLNYPLFAIKGVNQLYSVRYIAGLEHFNPGTVTGGIGIFPTINKRNRNWFEASYMREQYFTSKSRFGFGYLVQGVLSNQPNFANPVMTAIAAPRFAPTPNSRTLFMPEYSNSTFLGFGAIPTFTITNDRTFYVKAYAYMYIPSQFLYHDKQWYMPTLRRLSDHSEFIFGGSLVYQSIIGPASLTVDKYSTGPANWNIVFNFGYTLFQNRRY